jgi:hypothetical protein
MDAGGREADGAGLPHGFAMAIPMNVTSRTRRSAAVRWLLASPVTRWLLGVGRSRIVDQASVGEGPF